MVVAAFGLIHPADSDFDTEYAERTRMRQAEAEAIYDKSAGHHETNDKEKTTVIKNAKEKVDMIMRDKLVDLVSEFQLRFLERKDQRSARCDVQLENRVHLEAERGHRNYHSGTERDDRGAGGDGEAGA